MSIRINYQPVPDLPKLAWLACIDRKAFDTLSVFHGLSVECRQNWMIEGAWDGDFSSGEFHRAENVFGSGIRVVGDRVHFVTSSSLVDRLFYCFDRDTLLVSNSLVVLMGFTGARLNDQHDYYHESVSITNGIKKYVKEFNIRHPEIKLFYQVFYENIIATRDGVAFELKTGSHRIGSFEEYYDLLWGVLCRLRDNYKDPNRTIPVSAFTTISSGYDSTAVSCLAKKLGVETAFTIQKSASWVRWSSKHALDDGVSAAKALDLNVICADAHRSEISQDELFFLSTNYGKSKEIAVLNEVALASVAAHLEKNSAAAILFTGYNGDNVWDIKIWDGFLNDELMSIHVNIGFSEIRLKSGFINVPVPDILARNVKEIVGISGSEEMKKWSVGTAYDRPIARRIAESFGVPRATFGMHKKGVARHFYRLPINRGLRKLFLRYLKKQYGLNSWFVYANHALNQTAFFCQKVFFRISGNKRRIRSSSLFWPNLDISFLMWIWAAHLLSERMASTLQGIQAREVVERIKGSRC